MKNRSIKRRSRVLALTLLTSFAIVLSARGTQVARADSSVLGHDYTVMFTKWITCYSITKGCGGVVATMSGIITGGDAGTGAFSGVVLNVTKGDIPQIWKAEVRYDIAGTLHSFSAANDVTENDVTNKASIVGVITDGWLQGWPVQGSYIILPASGCPYPQFGPCYQVTLHIHVGS